MYLFWCGVLVSLSVHMAFVGPCYTAKYRQKEGMHTYFSTVDAHGKWAHHSLSKYAVLDQVNIRSKHQDICHIAI